MRSSAIKASLLLGSIAFAICLAEGLLRLLDFLPNPMLIPARAHDEILVFRLPSGWPDADRFGFRNRDRPGHAEIVTLGDSHTFGYNVDREQSWPSLLAKTTSSAVYNFGMGGYGPLQSLKLTEEAVRLHPKHIILGVYLQNDLADVCEAYGQASWWRTHAKASFELDLSYCDKDVRPSQLPPALRDLKKSLVSFVGSTRLAGLIKTSRYKREMSAPVDPRTWVTASRGNQIYEMTRDRFEALETATDLEIPKTAASFATTLATIEKMANTASTAGARFSVLIIPSREVIFSEILGRETPKEISRISSLETVLESRLIEALDERHIRWASPKKALVELAESNGPLYPTRDSHPFATGYAAYARSAFRLMSVDDSAENLR